MPVPYSVYTKISKETIIWKSERRRTRYHKNIVPIQKGGNSRRCGMFGSRAFMRKYSAKDKHIGIYGISKGEKRINDI